MKYNTKENVTNRERSNPRWGKLARQLACQMKVYSRHINKITHIQVNILTMLISILSHLFIGLGQVSLYSIKA